ncbi:hypothetical protein DUI87_30884 [Hirundo rustica rustica]|uniref:Uncharacterized protein n=1 Tax=Hirundo rustica rustica TaxID=333673 RepID=A0A3M0IVA2_HIRRU|nr:hypothetical protein DUI87_30884 [Hirundo rustica rustica]
MNSDNLELTISRSLNPAQFLSGEPLLETEHDCLELVDFQTKTREDLDDIPSPYGKKLFTDGSSRVIEGKRISGYAVVEAVEGRDLQITEKRKLPSNWSAQCCEVYALKRGLDLLEGNQGTIYTDSKYAFGIVHTFGKIWEECGYLNLKGKNLVHKELIRLVKESLFKPIEVAVVHVKGHQKGNALEIRGNQLAERTAKEAALDLGEPIKIFKLTEPSDRREEKEKPIFNEKELNIYQGKQGEWLTPDGHKFLNKALARKVLTEIHELTHWGVQGVCDHFLRENLCFGIYELEKSITQGCVTCQKVDQKIMRKTTPGGRELALRPFQNIQIDFTEMPPTQRYKHLLVIIDHLTRWVEAFPTRKETADVVVKILLEQIILRYGLVNIDSDRGPHFVIQILHKVIEALGIKWRLHTLWHPQSSGRVERVNKPLKNVLTKLIEEIQMNWLKCLPLALLQIRTRPRSDTGVSPYEMMFGLPFLITPYSTGNYLEGAEITQKYLRTIGKNLESLRRKGFCPEIPSLDSNVLQISPGDWVLIKSWNSTPLTPKFEGPFQVLLTSYTTVRTQEKGWTHITRVKGPVPPPNTGPDLAETSTSLPEWVAIPNSSNLKVQLLTATKGAPELRRPKFLSPLLRDFLSCCLQRDEARRCSAKELLQSTEATALSALAPSAPGEEAKEEPKEGNYCLIPAVVTAQLEYSKPGSVQHLVEQPDVEHSGDVSAAVTPTSAGAESGAHESLSPSADEPLFLNAAEHMHTEVVKEAVLVAQRPLEEPEDPCEQKQSGDEEMGAKARAAGGREPCLCPTQPQSRWPGSPGHSPVHGSLSRRDREPRTYCAQSNC